MALSLCSRFAASTVCYASDSSSLFGLCIRGPSTSLAAPPASFGRTIVNRYGRPSNNNAAENRRPMGHGGKWKKPVNPPVVEKPTRPVIEKPALPVIEKSTRPVIEKSAPPVVEKPARPVIEKSTRPVVEKSAPPVVGTLTPAVIRKLTPAVIEPVVENPDSDTSEEEAHPNWEEFGAAVSGEWDGYTAEFNMFGEPTELSSNVVPDAFREWEQPIHDWQTQCPTLAHPEPGHLWYKNIRLHPTVGCEADAATVYSVEKCDLPQNAYALAYHKTGSYTAVWRGNRVTNEKQGTGPGKEVTREGDEVEVEQCLVHGKTRIRVYQKLGMRRRVLISREAWEGPFRNGESLGACATVTQAFATQKPLLAKSLFGKWNSDIYELKNPKPHQGYRSSELVSSGNEEVMRNFSNTFLYLPLPKDTWTLLLKTKSGATTIETGWLVEPDLAIVTKCEVESSGELKEVSLRFEKRISSEVKPVKVSAEDLEELLIDS